MQRCAALRTPHYRRVGQGWCANSARRPITSSQRRPISTKRRLTTGSLWLTNSKRSKKLLIRFRTMHSLFPLSTHAFQIFLYSNQIWQGISVVWRRKSSKPFQLND